jgi:tetratricopeptide (TPR) repeat protein
MEYDNMKKKNLLFIFALALVLMVLANNILSYLGMGTGIGSPGFWISKIIIFVIIFLLLRKAMLDNSKRVINYLFEDMDPEKFIEATLRDVENVRNPKFKDLLKLNLSAGYIYGGDFEKAHELFDSINTEAFNEIHMLLFHNNYINLLLSENQVEKALATYNDNTNLFQMEIKNSDLASSVLSTKGAMAFHQGDIQESKELFTKSSQTAPKRLSMLSIKYYMALIAEKENNIDEAIKIMEVVKDNAGNTILKKDAEEFLSKFA